MHHYLAPVALRQPAEQSKDARDSGAHGSKVPVKGCARVPDQTATEDDTDVECASAEQLQGRDGVMEDGAREWEILLVEDNPADIRLTQEALKELRIRHRLQVAEDGGAALSYLEGTCDSTSGRLPDLILLDINLPVMNGLEVLAVIKASDRMKSIPVIIMSSSAAESDVATAYRLNANCYTKKPLELDGFFEVMDSIRHFWLETALLPGRTSSSIH